MRRSKPTVNGLPGTIALESATRLACTNSRPSYFCASAAERSPISKSAAKIAGAGRRQAIIRLLTISDLSGQRDSTRRDVLLHVQLLVVAVDAKMGRAEARPSEWLSLCSK